ncbi:hypothetical protein XENTR_v10010718 [Xenopus tropicalis]|nr:hypothetical protein XENTR_v10010718 [Xenopus tropicalis]
MNEPVYLCHMRSVYKMNLCLLPALDRWDELRSRSAGREERIGLFCRDDPAFQLLGGNPSIRTRIYPVTPVTRTIRSPEPADSANAESGPSVDNLNTSPKAAVGESISIL